MEFHAQGLLPFLVHRVGLWSVRTLSVSFLGHDFDLSNVIPDYDGTIRLLETTQVPPQYADDFNQCDSCMRHMAKDN